MDPTQTFIYSSTIVLGDITVISKRDYEMRTKKTAVVLLDIIRGVGLRNLRVGVRRLVVSLLARFAIMTRVFDVQNSVGVGEDKQGPEA